MKTSPLTITMTADGSATMELYSPIGVYGYQLKDFTSALAATSAQNITLRINSPGGEVIEALAIYDMIRASDKHFRAEVFGLCASAATLIACACDEIHMSANSTWMVHEPSFGMSGTLADCDKMRETMSTLRDKVYAIYSAHTGKDIPTLEADHESDRFYTAPEALEYGWIHAVLDAPTEDESDPEPLPTDSDSDDEPTAEVDTEDENDDPDAPAPTALFRLRASLGLTTKTEKLAAAAADWRRRALVAEAREKGTLDRLAEMKAESAALAASVDSRVSAAVANALAELAAPVANLPTPSEVLPEKPRVDLASIRATGGLDAAFAAAAGAMKK